MKKELNGTCHLCGAKYHRCDNCNELKRVFTSWKMLSDTEDHYKVFCILRNYNLGKIKKDEANKQLSAYDLSDVDNWTNENNKRLVKELMKVTRMIPKKKVAKIEEETDEVENIKEVNKIEENRDASIDVVEEK